MNGLRGMSISHWSHCWIPLNMIGRVFVWNLMMNLKRLIFAGIIRMGESWSFK